MIISFLEDSVELESPFTSIKGDWNPVLECKKVSSSNFGGAFVLNLENKRIYTRPI